MERMVLEVALKGDVASLKKLLDDYPLLLEESMTSVYSYTPLHVAAMLGYEDFANEILRRKPELAKELNSKQSSPLHLAAAMGHAGVVRALLLVDRGMLKGRDRDGLTPFHLAAVKGRVEVLKELMSDDYGEICSSELLSDEVMGKDGEKLGENILQMCVKYGQLEALKLLVEMIADRDGEAVKFLVQRSRKQVNGENNGKEMEVIGEVVAARRENSKEEPEKYKKKKESWVNEMREGLMVVASLLATMTFQAIVSPPGGVMQVTEGINQTLVDDTVIFSSLFHTTVLSGNLDNNAPAPAPTSESMMTTGIIGKSVMSYYKPVAYEMFLSWNTLSFVASLSVILLLISGLPLHRKFFMYVLMIAMWWSITAAAASYAMCLQMITSSNNLQTAYNLTRICYYLLDTVSFVIVIGHIIMVTVKLIKWLLTALLKLKKKKKKNSSSSMEHQV